MTSAPDICNVLAEYAASLRYGDLPDPEVDATRFSLIDTLAVAVAAFEAPGTRAALRAVQTQYSGGHCSVWPTSDRVPAAQAAFLNSLYAAALDFDSLHHLAVAHSDIVVVPTAVALAQTQQTSGQDLLTAIALGNDLLCRLALATRGEYKGWFFSSIYGVIASAAMTAKLLGGGRNEIANAMGLAAMNCAGTFQAIEERSMAKRALAAFAARSGIECGQLAMQGFEGPKNWLEGKHGLYSVYQRGKSHIIVEGLGERFESSRISRKPYPSCQCNQAAIEAAEQIHRQHRAALSGIRRVEISTTAYNHRIVGAMFDPLNNPQVAAQFSIQYSVACVLLRGQLGIAEIQDNVILDPEIRQLISRIEVTADPSLHGTYTPTTVVVETESGVTLSRRVSSLRGSVDQPFSQQDILSKLHHCLATANVKDSLGAAEHIMNRLWKIDQVTEAGSHIDEALRCLRTR